MKCSEVTQQSCFSHRGILDFLNLLIPTWYSPLWIIVGISARLRKYNNQIIPKYSNFRLKFIWKDGVAVHKISILGIYKAFHISGLPNYTFKNFPSLQHFQASYLVRDCLFNHTRESIQAVGQCSQMRKKFYLSKFPSLRFFFSLST